MAEQGGRRTPANPAPVSGPGRLSRRTDGGPTQGAAYMSGLPYGEGADFYDLQTSAPMAAANAATRPSTARGTAAPAAGALVPLGAPTQRPDEPLTEGNPLGPGAGSDVLMTPKPADARDKAMLQKYLPQLRAIASDGDAPAGFKAFVQFLNGA